MSARGGVLTRTVRHVPYRTVTNITVKRGLVDRWLGMGTLEIQTSETSGTTGVEQVLTGLENDQGVYALVAAETLNALLVEVRAIRRVPEARD